MATYEERVERFRIVRQEIITDPATRAHYRINGVDPDDCASLIYSFANLADAEKELAKQKEIEAKITEQYGFCSSFCSLVDGGQAEIFIRQAMW